MPNYEEGNVYKLCCRDTSVKDEYIGSTCNFTQRKYRHKSATYNKNGFEFNKKVYKFIRENGGWNNWDMVLLEEVCCENKKQLNQKEREWIEKLKPTLNCCIPNRTKKEYYLDNLEKTKKDKKEWYEKNKKRVNSKKFYCEDCEEELSYCNKTRHLKGGRHKYNSTHTEKLKKSCKKNIKNQKI
jgi:hypothetical protein